MSIFLNERQTIDKIAAILSRLDDDALAEEVARDWITSGIIPNRDESAIRDAEMILESYRKKVKEG